MGYLVSGYAFGAAPRWPDLQRLLKAFHVRGYRHKSGRVFLLDAWPAARHRREHCPFCAEPIRASMLGSTSAPASEIAAAFDAVGTLLGDVAAVEYGPNWLSVPLLIASAAGTPTFAFTADDDVFDFAAFIEAGAIVHAGCRLGPCKVFVGEQTLFVVPCAIEEDDYVPDDDLVTRLAAVPNVQVLETERIEGGLPLHEYPLTLWPRTWGNPTELLGLGTFDPFVKLEDDFEVVHESGPPSKTRWKFWS